MVFLTGEDKKDDHEYRLHHLVRAMGLTDAQRQTVRDNIYIEDLSGQLARLVQMDRGGNLTFTSIVDELVLAYRDIRPALVNLDPMVSFGPGERMVNDGEQAVVVAARRVVAGLGCCCRLVHHTGKQVARDGTVDQYSGRGGSALGDGVRSQAQLLVHATADKVQRPRGVTHEDIEEERVLRLHVNKLSHAERPKEPFWLVRDGWKFAVYLAVQEDPEEERRRREGEDTEVVLSYLRARLEEQPPIRYTRRSLEEAYSDVGVARNRVRTIVELAVQRGELEERELPQAERKGRRTHYLVPQP